MLLERRDHALQSLLELAAELGAGQQCTHVEREDARAPDVRHLPMTIRAAPGPRRWRSCRHRGHRRRCGLFLRRRQRICDGAFHLLVAPDQRIDLSRWPLLVKVDAVCLESLSAFLHDLLRRSVVVSSRYPLCFIAARRLRDPVRDIVYRVEPGHLLLLQVMTRMALAFRNSATSTFPSHFLDDRTLHVDRCPLEHPLETGIGFASSGPSGDQVGEFVIEVLAKLRAQLVEVYATSSQDRYGILILGEREQKMLSVAYS